MSELIEIEKGHELATLTTGIKAFIERIKKKIDFVNYDVETKQGRESIISSAFKVTKSKTGIVKEINRLIEIKKLEIAPTLATIELLKESKIITNCQLSELAKKTRQVVTDWEIEQEKIAEKLRQEMKAKENADKIDFDHEIGLVMNRNIDLEKKVEAIEKGAKEFVAEKSIEKSAKKEQPIFEPWESSEKFKEVEDKSIILGEIERHLVLNASINNAQAQRVVFALLTCGHIEIKYE